jgi:uncharacterized damage-inducible protein DinB
MIRIPFALVLIATFAMPAAAQMSGAQAGDPQVNAVKVQLGLAKNWVTRSAEKMSEEQYAFQPTKDVRTYGKVLAHIADANYFICSMGTGQKSPVEMGSVEKTKTAKADIQKALAESYAYCEQALGSLTAAQAAESVDMFGMPQTRLSVLSFNVAHNFEHYGNLVTYMRLKGVVPPSSEPRPGAQSGAE